MKKRKMKKKNVNYDPTLGELNDFADFPKPKIKKERKKDSYKGPQQCYRCGEIFKTIPEIKEHLTTIHFGFRKIHYGRPRDFQCQVCHIMFETEENLEKHNCSSDPEFLTKDRGNKCNKCNEVFSRREALVNHNRIFHITEKGNIRFTFHNIDFIS